MAVLDEDDGFLETEALIAKMEKRLNSMYSATEKEMRKKLNSFMREYETENKQKKRDLKAGKISQEQYDGWLQSKAQRSKWLTEMVNTLAEDCTTTDVKAMSMVRGFMPEAYAINRNYAAFEVEKGSMLDTSFTLYDAHTVENLIKNRPSLLPQPKPDIPKDMRWNKQKITSAVTKGILEGESIPQISKRLQNVTTMDKNAAIRNARTATTGAQNAGRVDGYKYAQSLGIDLKQEWLATLDSRTRESHRWMDGERVDVGKVFSNGCRYPGDPNGPSAEVYNCRCTLVAAIEGIDQSNAPRNSKLGEMSYDEWRWGKEGEEKEARYNLKRIENNLNQFDNKTYSGIWKNDVSVSDYEAKKDSIPKKEGYYNDQLEGIEKKIQQAKADGDEFNLEYYTNLKAIAEGHLADLRDFQKRGMEYSSMQKEAADLRKQLKQMTGGNESPFTSDAYSEIRKRVAKDFERKEDADKYLRQIFDSDWVRLTEYQKYSVWEYTHNSNPMNQPLSGYHDGWDRDSFVGIGKANWGLQDTWRRFNTAEFAEQFGVDGHVDYAQTISELTKAIDNSVFADADMWLVRKSNENGLAGLFEGDLFSYNDAMTIIQSGDTEKMREAFVGREFQNHAFCSTGMAKDAEWFGNVSYDIYAPQGTKGIYSEPASFFGGTISGEELYEVGKSYEYVGTEAEVILQRGTTFRITDIEYDYGDIKVKMEVVDQPDYFQTGYEQTIDAGATSYAKK